MRLLLLLTVCLLLLPHRPAHAEPFLAGTTLDQRLVADVTAAAFAFMGPRTLEAIPMAQLGLWGLRGLSVLDPRLTPDVRDGTLRLSLFGAPAPRLLLAMKLPPDPDAQAWGQALAGLIRSGWDASQPVRRAGTNGVLEAFFDEIANHLDPYSRYATPAEAQADNDARDGQVGIGITVAPHGDGYAVGAVLEGGPAAKAGIRPGEILVSIDGETLEEATPADISALLAGSEGSPVVLELRGRGGRSRTVAIERAVEIPPTVHARWIGKLVVVQISGFASDTAEHLADALGALPTGRKAPRGVVIDLRGNRGGLLRQAVAAAETLIPSGIVAVTIGRDPAANHEFHADGEDLTHGLPIVVLVDGGSASAAEILAAGLADEHRAVVVGSSTVGKGLVQAVEPLPNGAELLLTWSRVLAPLGWPIQGLGVLPQVCTSLGAEASSAQLAALARGEQPMAGILARHRTARPPGSSEDMLAIRSACPAADGHEGDLAAARFLIDHPTAYQTALLGPPP